MFQAEHGEAQLFAALGDPTRLGLIQRMSSEAPRSIAQLADGVPMSRQAVRKHLGVLEAAGLIRPSPSGREQRYTLVRERIEAAQAYLEAVSAQWDDALARLKAMVEISDH